MDSEDDDYGDDDMDNSRSVSSPTSTKPMTQAEKRAHHNALERKRRDHIKDSFTSLRDSVPSLVGEKVSKRVSSRAQILKKAAEYIQFMKRKNSAHQHDIEDLKRQNNILENQIRALDRAKLSGGPVRFDKNSKLNNSESENSDAEVSSSSSAAPVSSSSSNSSNSNSAIPPGARKLKVFSVSKP